MKTSPKRTFLLLFIAIVAVITLYPFETTVVPEWRVRVVEQAGTPLRNVMVKEVWEHYSVESQSHEQDLPTDADGYVTFPKRTIRASLAVRIIGRSINTLNPHGSSGPGAYLVILARGYDSWSNDFYIPGQPLPTEVVVTKASQSER
jgi:hypothetical protein